MGVGVGGWWAGLDDSLQHDASNKFPPGPDHSRCQLVVRDTAPARQSVRPAEYGTRQDRTAWQNIYQKLGQIGIDIISEIRKEEISMRVSSLDTDTSHRFCLSGAAMSSIEVRIGFLFIL